MSGINALSTGAATKNSEEGFSLTEKAQNGTDSAMLDFAAIFSNWVAQLSGQGQNSGFQSNEPASKDANSGKNSLLGLDGLQALVGSIQRYGNAQEILEANVQDVQIPTEYIPNGYNQNEQIQTLDSFIAQIEDLQNASPSQTKGNAEDTLEAGMLLGKPQGKSPQQLELALYKGVISELLKEMSGSMELKTPMSSEGLSPIAQQKLELAAQRLNSGLFQMTNEGGLALKQTIDNQAANMKPAEIQAANLQGGITPADQARLYQDAAPVKLSANPEAIGFAYTKEQAGAKAEQQRKNQLINELRISQGKESNPAGLTDSLGSQDDPVLLNQISAKTAMKGEIPASNPILATNLMTSGKKDLSETEAHTQSSKIEEVTGQEPSLEELGSLAQVKGSVQVQDRAVNKPDLPIWAQVAREVHDKAYQARPHLREMEIQLHPAELGQIRLSLRWEDGQVHLRMMASEPGTGQMLQANLSELRDNLTQLGVQCGMMEMNMGHQQENSREQGRNKPSRVQVENEDLQETQSIQTILDVDSSSLINVTA